MNFNINNLFHNYAQTDMPVSSEDSTKLETEEITHRTDGTGQSDGIDALKQLSVGDIFRAKILDIRNMDVRILLSNHQEVRAMMGEALELNIGEELTFQVKSNGENGIILRPVGNSEIPAELVTKSLLSAGISVNDRNMAIVKELITHGQPIDRQSVLNMVKLLNEYKGESIDKLARMIKHGIEVTPENLEQYDKYMNYEHKLSDSLHSLSDYLVNYIQEESAGGIKPLIQLFTGLSQALGESSGYRPPNLNSQVIKDNVEEQESMINNKNDVLQNAETAETAAVNPSSQQIPQQKKGSELHNPPGNREESPLPSETGNHKSPAVDSERHNTITEQPSAQTEHTSLLSKDLGSKIMKDMSQAQTFRELAGILEQIDRQGYSQQEVLKIFHTDAFRKAMKTVFREKGLLNISDKSDETILEKKDINNLYQRLLRISDIIEKNMKGDSPQGNNLLNHAKDMKNNILFMNELNQIASYVQLPFKINSRHEHGDLYVYGRKRGKTDQTEKITAFLHLDMDSLGATDISVELVNQAISTKFTLDNRVSQKIVEEHLHELQERLEKKGYSVNLSAEMIVANQTSQANPSNNVLQNIFEHDEKATGIKRYSFDIRA